MNILLIGPQGSGKGTQGRIIAQQYGLAHISSGDMFRDEYALGTDLGIKAHVYWNKGQLVPDELTLTMILKRLEGVNGCVLDGFPRTVPQAEALEKALKLDYVIELDQPKQVTIDRLSSRRQCDNNHVYGTARPVPASGLCEDCSKPLKQREDDAPQKIEQRLNEYHIKTKPLLDFYTKRRVLYKVDAAQPPEKVTADIVKIITPP